MSDAFTSTAGHLAAVFARGVDAPLDDAAFDELARRVFAVQFELDGVYRAFCTRRGVTPATLTHWSEIPAVPASAFKHLSFVSGDPDAVEAVFHTSGTTHGAGARGEHRVRSLALYEAASLPNLEAHLLPDRRPDGAGTPFARLPILSLVPDAAAAPGSSLSRMMHFALREFGAPGSASFTDPERGVDIGRLAAALGDVTGAGADVRPHEPVWIAGTAFAFVHWLDAVARGDAPRVTLPEGSRLMETGGFKGRSREVPRDELYAALADALGIAPARMVNEYGMTELLSQFYEPVLVHGAPANLADRVHVGPPWVRTRVLDPATLEPVPDGTTGLLCHVDLANLGSVSALLTSDLGIAHGHGFRVLGRIPGAEPRGCSLALEELLA